MKQCKHCYGSGIDPKNKLEPYEKGECRHNHVYYHAKTDTTKCKICGKIYNENNLKWE